MIQVISGPLDLVREYCAEIYLKSAQSYWVDASYTSGLRRYWSGLRCLLPQIRARLGDEEFEEILYRDSTSAKLLLQRIEARTKDARLEALLDSNLSHNWYIKRPLLENWAKIIHSLFHAHRRKPSVVIPSVTSLDWLTLESLRVFLRMFPDSEVDMHVGYSSGERRLEYDASDGFEWIDEKKYTEKCVNNLLMLEDSELLRIAEPRSTGADRKEAVRFLGNLVPKDVDLLDDDLDSAVIHALVVSQRRLSTSLTEQAVELMWRAFRVFDFPQAASVGLRLLEREASLNPRQMADVHGIIGLCFHNRQFRAVRDPWLADFLEEQFRKALEQEVDCGRRACIMYRLAVTLGRRKADFERALIWANRGLEAIAEPKMEGQLRAALHAWLLNIRSYIFMKKSDFPSAIADGEEAFRSLDEFSSGTEDLSREFCFLYALIPDNLSKLSEIARKEDRARYWLLKCRDISGRFVKAAHKRWSAQVWIKIHRKEMRLDKAIEIAHLALEEARSEKSAEHEVLFLAHLGDLYYRVGNSDSSYMSFRKLLGVREKLGDVEGQFFALFNMATAAYRAGFLERSALGLERALIHPQGKSAHARLELLGWLALAAARQGDRRLAESSINEAISIASGRGERDRLIWITRVAGDACRSLGLVGDAIESYENAMEMLQVEANAFPPPATEIVGVLLGIMDCKKEDEVGYVVDILHALPEALIDVDAWWYLPRFMPYLRFMRRGHEGSLRKNWSDRELGAVDLVRKASSQRKDCREFFPASSRELVEKVRSSVA